MGPAYLRELEGVVLRYATASSTSILQPNPSESGSELARVPRAMVPNDDPTATAATAAGKEPPPVALLVSESAFTRHCLLAAHASPLPFLLVHLPPLPPSTSTSSNGGSSSSSGSAIGAVFGNPALISAKGVLGGELEIRWERGGSGVPSSQSQSQSQSQSSGMLGGAGAGRPRLWWQGQPLPSWTPDAGADVDGDGVALDH
jgi:hypothetical protein